MKSPGSPGWPKKTESLPTYYVCSVLIPPTETLEIVMLKKINVSTN